MTDTAEILREVAAAVRAPDLDRAIDLAESALAQGVEHAMLLNLQAYRLEQQGRLPEALANLRRARELAPQDVPTLNALGLCLARLGQTEAAIEAFETATLSDPAFAPAHFNLAWNLEEAGDPGAAKASYERAQALTPASAAPGARLAFLAARRGDFGEARRLGERAVLLEAGQPSAILALAWADLASKALVSAERRLRALLATTSLSETDRVLGQGLLGDVLDAGGRADEAFAVYASANAALKAAYADRFAAPGQSTAADQLDGLIAHMQAAAPRAKAPAPMSPPAGHVFLVGFPRSGTTLLERALGAHRDIVAWDERENLVDAVRVYMADPGGLDRLTRATEPELDALREAYWRRVAEGGAVVDGKVALDKLPLNTMKLPLIARLFPGAKILFAVRDPRDVILSGFRQRFRINASMYELLTLEGGARFYDGVMRLADLCHDKLDLAWRQHRYEDLVADFDTQTRGICDFLGLAWDAGMRRFAETLDERGSATPSAGQVARGLYTEGVGQWRRFRAQLAPVSPLLAPWVARFGYEPE